MINKHSSLGPLLSFLLIIWLQQAYGQNGVAIAASTATADNSAMLDVQSTTKGALIPRMTNAQRAAISSPANGLLVYCTDAPVGLYYYNTAIPAWVILSAGALTGAGTTNYDAIWTGSGTLGTGLIYNNGSNVGMGTTTPNYKLDVAGSIGIANNSNTSTNKLYLASGDANHYIYSTGSGGNSMFFGEYLGVFNFYNTSTSTTQVSFNAGAVSATGAINSGVGYTVAGAAASGNYLRGNGTDFVSSAIQASDLSAGISGTANYMAKFTGANTVGNSSVIYESGGEIGINNTSPATGAAISFTTSGGGTTNNIAWGTGPYSSIYDNANVHYWTDDYTNYESGATGASATFAWVVGVAKSGAASPGGTVWMSLNNGNLLVSNLAGTGYRPVWTDASGNLNNSGRVWGSNGSQSAQQSTGTISAYCSTGNMNVISGELIEISGHLGLEWNGGSGTDHWIMTVRWVSVSGGCGSQTINLVRTAPTGNANRSTTSECPFVLYWNPGCTGTGYFTIDVAREDADDSWWCNNGVIVATKQ